MKNSDSNPENVEANSRDGCAIENANHSAPVRKLGVINKF